MAKECRIAIIGAGTAGLSAYKEAKKYTQDILVIDQGPLGSTCARIGCMPSKVLIHIANAFYSRHEFSEIGIQGSDELTVNLPQALSYVRKMRDHFTSGVVQFTQSLGSHFLQGRASFIDANTLSVGNEIIKADVVIIATGSQSVVPSEWQLFKDNLLTTESIFEQENIASELAVIGGGVVGLELGQALSRLGIAVSLFHSKEKIAGLTDPVVNEVAVKIFQEEFPVYLGEKVDLGQNQNGLRVQSRLQDRHVGQVLVSAGRAPNLKNLNLEALDISLGDNGIPEFDANTMKIKNHAIYLAGDVNKVRPFLHEAADEGRIAGFNAAHSHEKNNCFKRRTPISIIFTQPNIIAVGESFEAVQNHCVIGSIDYRDQGRAKIESINKGLLRVYVDRDNGCLLGCEGIVPDGEHLAHQLACFIQAEMTVHEILKMPFYHPVVEEGMRTALRDAAKKLKKSLAHVELAMCDSQAVSTLS